MAAVFGAGHRLRQFWNGACREGSRHIARSPLDGFNALLEALNQRDAEGVWSRPSTSARSSLAREEVVQMVESLTSADPDFHVSLQSVHDDA
jgi:hypothetical protein